MIGRFCANLSGVRPAKPWLGATSTAGTIGPEGP